VFQQPCGAATASGPRAVLDHLRALYNVLACRAGSTGRVSGVSMHIRQRGKAPRGRPLARSGQTHPPCTFARRYAPRGTSSPARSARERGWWREMRPRSVRRAAEGASTGAARRTRTRRARTSQTLQKMSATTCTPVISSRVSFWPSATLTLQRGAVAGRRRHRSRTTRASQSRRSSTACGRRRVAVAHTRC
jgi:hypothetical protein